MEYVKHREIIEGIKREIVGNSPTKRQIQALQSEAQLLLNDYPEKIEEALRITRYVKSNAFNYYMQDEDRLMYDLFYLCLKFEAPHRFESYISYMEKNRPYSKKFYARRKNPLSVVVQDLQDLEDRKIKFYGLSMPSRVGKLIADDIPVLTTEGWKPHGELRVNDYVYGIDGEPKRVLHIFPKNEANVRVKFSNGEIIDCHENHEWVLVENDSIVIKETKALEVGNRLLQRRKLENEENYQRNIFVADVERIKPKQGNCIQVEGGIYCVGKRCVPTHNSTICIFFMTWIMGKRPNSHNAMSGHSGPLADGFYEEALNFITSPEYTFSEIFPQATLQKKSAEKREITLDRPDRFATLTCRGIDGTWTGAVDISSDGYLYVDDLVKDRTESLSPIRLNNRYQDYLNVLVDRKLDGARELMVGTRWNTLDPLGKVEEQFKYHPEYRFRKIPALDENNESNFKYTDGVGFSTKYYMEVKLRLDNNEWMAKYQQEPYIREGIIFQSDELHYYNGVLPEGDSRVVSVVDVAWGGGDSLSMPIGREYENGDVYIFDWLFNRGTKEVTIPKVVGKIVENEIKQINFEANNGGDMYCDSVSQNLKLLQYRCSCTYSKAPGNMEKMVKILASSGNIKQHFYFLEPSLQKGEYKEAMEELCSTVQIGKNLHDDAADSIAQLDRFLEGKRLATLEPVKRPF